MSKTVIEKVDVPFRVEQHLTCDRCVNLVKTQGDMCIGGLWCSLHKEHVAIPTYPPVEINKARHSWCDQFRARDGVQIISEPKYKRVF